MSKAKIIALSGASTEDADARSWRSILVRYLFGRMPLKHWAHLDARRDLTEAQAADLLRSIALLESFRSASQEVDSGPESDSLE